MPIASRMTWPAVMATTRMTVAYITARSAVQCRYGRLSEAVSPAKSARVAIGLIVVKSVAKSLLILIKSGDICRSVSFIFFFQAEDGIRDLTVTGVQTCALPI